MLTSNTLLFVLCVLFCSLDICQFVAFREYEGAPPERLGAGVLAELPGNIVDFFVGSCDPPIMPGQGPMLPSMHF